MVFVDGDTHVTLEASRTFADNPGEDLNKLWRTPYLVNNFSTICLAIVTSAQSPYTSYALTSAMQTGVYWAKDNYNALGSFGLTFKVAPATLNSSGQLSHNTSGCTYTTWIYQVTGGAGGSAGFPSGNGAPYAFVKLNSGLAGYSQNVHEHVAGHELGHTIGLRHADWKTRVSCGQSGESQSGASLIPGTVDQTTNSLMAACFSSSEDGEFHGDDFNALNTLY
jgi:hypothetical protein